MGGLRTLLRVGEPGWDLSAVDAPSTPGLPNTRAVQRDPKAWARTELLTLGERLQSSQERLYAGAKGGGALQRVLVVLQAMDCGGKDGVIKRVAGAMNPLGISVHAFGPPTVEERAHDFLWRVRKALPDNGFVGFFNRSHYEDVLIVRVRGLVPESTWRPRYAQINEFERELAQEGTTIVKVMLHISYEEQRERLLARLDDPTKQWKYHPSDVEERVHWADYQAAYQDVLTQCSTPEAPWYVVPADRKWYRDWAVATLVADTLDGLDLRYPEPGFTVSEERRRLRQDPTG